MHKRYLTALIIFIMAFYISACSSGNEKDVSLDTATVQTTEKAAESTIAETSAPAAEVTASATESEPASSVQAEFKLPVEGTRPVAVMIDNEGTRSLPQGGLYKAQIIYEIIVEGGETRLMPLFWGDDIKMIGPVRSSRHYFLDYVMENDAIYVHFGWSPMAQSDIPKLKINNINGISNGGEIFWDITKDRGNWQDSYTSMQNIWDYVKKVKYRTDTDKQAVFKYNQPEYQLLNGQNAEKVSIRYSSTYTCGFEYDSAAKSYMRFRKGAPQMERETGKQLEAKNIIIQYTPNNKIKGDTKDRQEVKTTGTGSGYFITNGKAIKIKWKKETRSSKTIYTDESGNEILLNPGQTWIQVLPLTGKATIS